MIVSLVVARADNGVIGRDNALPWRLGADLRNFRRITMGHPIVMGRRTFESIGRPLPGRHNIVVSRNPSFRADGCTVVSDWEAARRLAGGVEELMVIGGASLYQAAWPQAQRIYLTEVHARVTGDVCFPRPDPASWRELRREFHRADARNEYDYSFVCLQRRDTDP